MSYSYLDDLNLAGEQRTVAHAFQYVRDKALEIGLEFNSSKCEVIPTAGLGAVIDRNLFPADVIFREDGNFELLGGPIGSDSYCNEHTKQRVDKAKEVLKALGELPDPQVALSLLRHCASFGKLVYSLRVVPHRKHREALRSFDSAVRNCIESFYAAPSLNLNGHLQVSPRKWVVLGSAVQNSTVLLLFLHPNLLVGSFAKDLTRNMKNLSETNGLTVILPL